MTSAPVFTMTLAIVTVPFALILLLPLATTLPVPRTLAVIVPDFTSCVATSVSDALSIVCEKNVSTSSTARNTIAASFTHVLFLTSVSMSVYLSTVCSHGSPERGAVILKDD